MAPLTSEKVDVKTRSILRDDFIMIKTKSDRITVRNRQCVIIVGGFNNTFSIIDKIKYMVP